MANYATNTLLITGPDADAVEALVVSVKADPSVLNAETFYTADFHPAEGGTTAVGEFGFSSAWHGSFAEVEALSAAHPGLVATLAAVELANLVAKVAVYAAGEEEGCYEMPDDELAELGGQEADDEEVTDSLLATADSWADDALTRLKTSRPSA